MATAMTGRMTLTEIEVEFRQELVTAAASVSSRRSIIIELETGGAIGWGESPAFPSGRFGTSDEAWDALTAPSSWPGDLPDVPIAAAGLQAARADAAARSDAQPLHTWLGGEHRPVLARHPIGLVAPDGINAALGAVAALDVTAIKLKIAPGRDHEVVAALRTEFPDLDIGVDANATYSEPDDPVFERLAHMAVSFIEQPFPAHALDAHRALKSRELLPVCLDETLDDPQFADRAMTPDTTDLVSIKLNRHGLARFDSLRTLATERGIDVRVGGTFDTSVGRRHLLAAATLPGITDAEVGPPSAYLLNDIAQYPMVERGMVVPSMDAGIGVEPDPSALERVRLRRLTVSI